jgi:hypothetical protein
MSVILFNLRTSGSRTHAIRKQLPCNAVRAAGCTNPEQQGARAVFSQQPDRIGVFRRAIQGTFCFSDKA